MNNYYFFTKNANNYLYNDLLKQFIYLNPVLAEILKQKTNNKFNPEDWLKIKEIHKENTNNISQLVKKAEFIEKYIIGRADSREYSWDKLPVPLIKKEFLKTKAIIFEVTERCNLACKYCAYSEIYENGIDRSQNDLLFNDAKILIDKILSDPEYISVHKNDSVNIGFYGGEPLLKMDLIKDIINYIEKEYPNLKYKYRITTNGVLLDKYYHYLIQKDFTLMISLDGDKDANSYRVFKNGNESYEIVHENIKKIINKNIEYFNKKVVFNSIITNKSSYYKMSKYFQENYNKNTSISELSSESIVNGSEELYREMKRDALTSFYEDRLHYKDELFWENTEYEKEVTQLRLRTYFIGQYYTLDDLINEEITCKMFIRGCIPFSVKVFLSVSGKLYPCERTNRNVFYGQIFDDEIFQYAQISQNYSEKLNKLKNQCENCARYYNCNYCIFKLNLEDGRVKCPRFITVTNQEKVLSELVYRIEQNNKLV